MLHIAKSLRDLNFSALMEVYLEGNREKAESDFSDLSTEQGIYQAEQDFYQYLWECFFKIPGACYGIWEEKGRYISALRWEPYQDGVLISALETAPAYRGQGYASKLLTAVLEELEGPVYSHVSKHNTPSLCVHRKCGFQIISESAKYLDGSVNSRAYTLRK